MVSEKKYDVSGLVEAQFEPGSSDRVLRNRLGIVDPDEMDRVEARALESAMGAAVSHYDANHTFRSADLCDLHRSWLKDIYEWAGQYRQVNLSKGDLPFAAAAQIPALMEGLERETLRRHTPCTRDNPAGVVTALAETHVELVLIHPFRDGNGRVARMLSTLMALQADLPLLDFRPLTGTRRENYFLAIQAGLDRNYEPMERLFTEIIERTPGAS